MASNEKEVQAQNDIMPKYDNYSPNQIINNNNDNINDNLSGGDFEQNLDINNNMDLALTQKTFVQTLNLQIKQLQELLNNRNKDFDNLNIENNKLKLLLIEEQKKIIDKENLIHSINMQKKNVEEQLNKKIAESENLNNKIKELNYKLIELNQSMITKENIYQFNNKIKNVLEKDNTNNDNQNQNELIITEKYEIELKRLSNLIDELEIKNNKLLFDNKSLSSKIEIIANDKNSELNMYKSIYQITINNLNKQISNLNNRISQFFSEKNDQKNINNYNNLIKKEIIQKFNELENKLNEYDKENCDLKSENQNLNSTVKELKLVIESKEKIIQKLQTDFEIMENEYNNNVFTSQKLGENLKKNDIDKSQYINELQSKQEKLTKENKDLKFGLKQMTKNINEANQLYSKKKAEYDKTLLLRDNKLKEYKTKITLLKMKINELHQEIKILKEYKGVDFLNSNNNNHYSFLTQNNNNNDNNNKIKNEHKKYITYTPKARKNKIPFEINLDNRTTIQNNENSEGNEIFGDLKISEVPKDNNSIKPSSIKNNNDLIEQDKNISKNKNNDLNKLANNEQDLKYIQEYKKTLDKIDEQLNKLNS